MKKLTTTIRSGYFASGLFLLFLLTVLGASAALACHKGVPHGKYAPEACTGYPPTDAPDVWANWGGYDVDPGIMELDERLCVVKQMSADGSSGGYACEIKYEYFMFNYELMTPSCLHKSGVDWLCEPKVSGGYQCPDDEYSFSWSGDCTSETGCQVTIINRFSKLGNNYGYIVDHTTLEAFGTISESPTHNPFATAQAIDVTDLHYTLFGSMGNGHYTILGDKGNGKKVLAECGLQPTAETPTRFYTRPAG